jgi:hypothetical protein
MEARAELERLLGDLFDRPPDAARNEQLAGLLRAHPELHGDYLDYVQLHALLQWRAGKAPRETTPAQAQVTENLPVPVSASAPRWRSARGLAAALLVLAASLAAFFIWYMPEAQASPDVVERLIDLNLDLTQAQTPEERTRIYESQAADLKASLARTDLPPEDRKLAESLLENGELLTKKVDRIAEADRFDGIMAKLVARMDAATEAQDEKRMIQSADAFQRIAEVGVMANLDMARASAAQDAKKKHKWEQMRSRHASRTTQVADIIDRHPEPSRKAIHKAMKGHGHKKKR